MNSVELCGSCMLMLDDMCDYVYCPNCHKRYHFKPCCSLAEETWKVMSAKTREQWRCLKCKENKRLIGTTTIDCLENISIISQPFKRLRKNSNNDSNMEGDIKEIKKILVDLSMRGKQEEERNIERFSSLEAQISLLLNKQAQQDEKIQELNERTKDLEKRSENKLLEKRINDLEQEKL